MLCYATQAAVDAQYIAFWRQFGSDDGTGRVYQEESFDPFSRYMLDTVKAERGEAALEMLIVKNKFTSQTFNQAMNGKAKQMLPAFWAAIKTMVQG